MQILLLKTMCSPPQFLIPELARVRFEFEIRGVVVIVTRLQAGRPRIRLSIPRRVKIYLHFHHSVHTSSGVQPASYSVGTESFFPGVEWSGRVNDHSPPPSDRV